MRNHFRAAALAWAVTLAVLLPGLTRAADRPERPRVIVLTEISNEPDGDAVTKTGFVYPEAGTYGGTVVLSRAHDSETRMVAPAIVTASP